MENLICLWDNFPLDIFFAWVIPALILWWWLNKRINRYKEHAAELQDRINFLEGELEACRNKKSSRAKVDVGAYKTTIKSLKADLAACKKAGLATAAAGTAGIASIAAKPKKKDDLKIVEGIGPKIEKLCNAADIYSFKELAETKASAIKAILDAAGPRFKMHDPTTWPAQSAMARDGKWDELKVWQDELNKGKE